MNNNVNLENFLRENAGALLVMGLLGIVLLIFIVIISLIIFLLPWILWIKQMKRLTKKGKIGCFWVVFVIGIVATFFGLPFLGSGLWLGPLFAGLIGLCLGRGKDNFQCRICFFKYKSDMLGNETSQGGKICLPCSRGKQNGRIQ